jgi:3-oxoacyl-[acyl-carrier protein] reductase
MGGGVELSGKVAIVTGGGKGIGAAIARELATAGARVVVNFRSSEAQARALADQIGGLAVQADVSTTDGCLALAEAAAKLGGIDILVNNAGITRDRLLLRMTDADWDEVMATNAGGPFRMCRAVLRGMAKQRQGAIVNIASVSAIRGNAGQANYAASKAAVVALTRSLAREMARRNIRVNCIAPGFIRTDMTDALTEAQRASVVGAVPLGRMGEASEIAPAVRFFCGPGSAYLTGQVLAIDGGLSV